MEPHLGDGDAQWSSSWIALHAHLPAHGGKGNVVGGQMRVRAVLPIRGDGHVHDARVGLLEDVKADTQLVHMAWRGRLDYECVCLGEGEEVTRCCFEGRVWRGGPLVAVESE